MKNYLLLLLIAGFLSACNTEETINPDIVGKWGGTKTVYAFETDGSYYFLNGRTGTTLSPIISDSTFGTFKTNTEKSQVTFYQEGYRDKESQKIVEQKNQVIWKYTIEGSILKYSSPTTDGDLTKL